MQLQDFLTPEPLGKEFVAVRGYEQVLDKTTGEVKGYRLNISIQDEDSIFYLDKIKVNVQNINPTLSVQEMQNNKTRKVILKDLKVNAFVPQGQSKATLYYTCSDVQSVREV